jgi:hypothetical protein
MIPSRFSLRSSMPASHNQCAAMSCVMD